MKMLATILISVMTAMIVSYYLMRKHEKRYHAKPCACKSKTPTKQTEPSGDTIQPVGDATPIQVGDALRTIGVNV